MKINKHLILIALLSVFFTGCSLKNPFGVGYESSVSESSKTFGVSGAPKDIYNHRDAIRKVQDDYLNSGIKEVLYFGIDKHGHILVKKDRDEEWTKYELSKWKDIIDEANAKNKKLEEKLHKEREKRAQREAENGKRAASSTAKIADIPVTEKNDLSVSYKEQGQLISTRTQVGDIIRDNGKIQQVFVANYVDNTGNLVSSHELYVVVREPSWIVGEKTPKNQGNLGQLPTPISKAVFDGQNRAERLENQVIDSFNRGDTLEETHDVINKLTEEELRDQEIIRQFIQKEKK